MYVMNDAHEDNYGPARGVNEFEGSNVQRQAFLPIPHVKINICCHCVVTGREPVSRRRWPRRYGQNRPVQLLLVVPQ